MGSSYPSSPSLPLGVAVLAILIGIIGFFFVLGALLLLILGVALGGTSGLFVGGVVGKLLLLIFGVVLMVVASGLWHRELWALALTILVLVLILIGEVVAGRLLSVTSVVVILLLVYLVLVREHFT
jgi:hypothetical protein